MLQKLYDASQQDDGPAVFLVVPSPAQGAAVIEGLRPLSVPVTSPAQRLRPPQSWIENRHRGSVLAPR